MSEAERFPGRHPLCTCPEPRIGDLMPDRSKCKGGTIAHPIVSADDIREFIRRYEAGEAVRA